MEVTGCVLCSMQSSRIVGDRISDDGWDGAVGPLASGLSVVLVCLGVDGSEWFEWFAE